jgi:hypothetical protein
VSALRVHSDEDRSAGAADRLSLEAIMLALRLVALALGALRPFSQVFDLTSGPIVWLRDPTPVLCQNHRRRTRCIAVPLCELDSASVSRWAAFSPWAA